VSSPAANRRGILAMLAAMMFFIGNDTLLKLAASTYPPGQIMAIRSGFASLMALGLVAGSGELGRLRSLGSPVVLGRACLEAIVAFLYITSVSHLALANITAISQATPIILTLMTVAFGIERVGWRRWCAVFVGFAGVLLVVKPSPTGFDIYGWIALAAAAVVAGRDLVTRLIGDHIPSVVVTLSTTSAVGLAGLLVGLGEEWQPLATREVLLLLSAAVLVTLGNLAIIVAFRGGDVSVVSPFRYSIVVFAVALGFLVFGEWPDAIAWLGTALIVGSGVYTMHGERLRRLDATAMAAGDRAAA
jgi:drug/metabolite transporter (DMT)-like permease